MDNRLYEATKKQIELQVGLIEFRKEIKDIIMKCLEIDYSNRIDSKTLYILIKNLSKRIFRENSVSSEYDYFEKIKAPIPVSTKNDFLEQNDMKRLFVDKVCVVCKTVKSESLIFYRFLHYAHISCLIKNLVLQLKRLDEDCLYCFIDPLNFQKFQSLGYNFFVYLDCDNCPLKHECLVVDYYFRSRLYECIRTNNIVCSLCDANYKHEHCLGILKFFEDFISRFTIYSSPSTEILMQKYDLNKILMKEKHQKVDLAKNFKETYVLKIVNHECIDPKTIHIHSIACLLSKNILFLYYWYKKNQKYYIYLKYCKNKTLKREIIYRKNNFLRFTTKEIFSFISDLTEAVIKLHEAFIYHQNLVLENVYFSNNYRLLIGNFENSIMLNKENLEKHYADIFSLKNCVQEVFLMSECVDNKTVFKRMQKFFTICENPGTLFNFEEDYKIWQIKNQSENI